MASESTVIFIGSQPPAIEAGEYRLTATQTVSSDAPGASFSDSFEEKRHFCVRSPRFAFEPSIFHSVYPPRNARGDFSRFLPHVVLRRRSLAWERRAIGGAQTKVQPWLAVLLFREGEGVVEREQGRAGELMAGAAGAKILSYAYPRLEYGETKDDPCFLIDVPAALFHRLAPSADDLRWLAHARSAHDACSVVVGSRLPEPGAHVAHLVSLEGMGRYLPGSDGRKKPFFDSVPGREIEIVRLVSLQKWTFTNVPIRHSFRSFLESPALQPGPLRPKPGAAPVHRRARRALATGFLPLPHRLRTGGKAVSWYRSAFSPVPVSLEQHPFAKSSDAALRFDPDMRMLDASRAAAWQLGRLLALRNTPFAASLCHWKKAAREQLGRHLLRSSLSTSNLQEHLLHVLRGEPVPSPRLRAPNAPAPVSMPPVPEIVASWLRQLAVLEGVPFEYLVPDRSLLPSESLRFFHADPNWIGALLQGAFSVGTTSPAETLQDEALAQSALQPPSQRPVFGFLLRSEAVVNWPGIEVAAYRAKAELNALRVAVVPPNVLLALFDGVADRLELHQAAEGVHFGFAKAGAAPEVNLRSLLPENAGAELTGADGKRVAAIGSFRAGGDRVVAVDAVTRAVEERLRKERNIDSKQVLNPASFAVQMIEGVEKVVFAIRRETAP